MGNPALIAHGPMFIGFTLNAILMGIMITQVYLYFTTYKKDPLLLKLLVLFLLVADAVNTVFDFMYIYNVLILNFGDFPLLEKADWLFATDPAITGIIASTVQLFFAWRIRVLTKSWTLVSLVVTMAVAGGVGAIVTAYEVGKTPNFVDFRNFKSVVILWLASESVGDILITTILVRFFCRRKHKTGFKNSDMIVDRIIRVTVQTGAITSLVAILDMIFFLADPTGTHLIFNFPLCKLYTNSMMSSLNSRRGWRFANSTQLSGTGGGHAVGSPLTEEEGSFRVNTCGALGTVESVSTAATSVFHAEAGRRGADVKGKPAFLSLGMNNLENERERGVKGSFSRPRTPKKDSCSFELQHKFSPTNRPEIFVSVESHQQLDCGNLNLSLNSSKSDASNVNNDIMGISPRKYRRSRMESELVQGGGVPSDDALGGGAKEDKGLSEADEDSTEDWFRERVGGEKGGVSDAV